MKNISLSRKWLAIGISITAVILLTLSSLTNVVGYQSVKSTVNDSPLFVTRTQRAINQQQNIMTSQYLGMGKGNLLQFPIRDSRTEQLSKTIDIICNMDDTTFARFTELCIQKARQDDTLHDLSRNQIVQALLILKTKPEFVVNTTTNGNYQDITSSGLTLCDLQLCFIYLWLLLGLPIYFLILFILQLLYPTTGFDSCRSHCICQH